MKITARVYIGNDLPKTAEPTSGYAVVVTANDWAHICPGVWSDEYLLGRYASADRIHRVPTYVEACRIANGIRG